MGRPDWPVALLLAQRGSDIVSLVFRIGSRRIYVDMPLRYYIEFLEDAMSLVVERSEELERARRLGGRRLGRVVEGIAREAKVIAEKYNDILRHEGLGWFRLVVWRNPMASWGEAQGKGLLLEKYNYVLGYRINWRRFSEFVERFSTRSLWVDRRGREAPLHRYYDYINSVYRYALLLALYQQTTTLHRLSSLLSDVSRAVEEKVSPDLREAREATDTVQQRLESLASRRLLGGPFGSAMGPMVFLALHDMRVGLASLKTLLPWPPYVYTALRRLIDTVSSVYGLSVLLARDFAACRSCNDLSNDFTRDLIYIIHTWADEEYYKECRESGHVLAKLNMRDLLGPGEAVEVLRGFLNKALEESGLGSLITRKKLWRVLEYSASISTIIALKALIQGE